MFYMIFSSAEISHCNRLLICSLELWMIKQKKLTVP